MPPSISTDRVGAIGERYNASYCATAPIETSLPSSRRAKIMHRTQRGHFRGSTDTQRAIFRRLQGAQQGAGQGPTRRVQGRVHPESVHFRGGAPPSTSPASDDPRRRAAPALAVARQPPPRRGRHLPGQAPSCPWQVPACPAVSHDGSTASAQGLGRASITLWSRTPVSDLHRAGRSCICALLSRLGRGTLHTGHGVHKAPGHLPGSILSEVLLASAGRLHRGRLAA